MIVAQITALFISVFVPIILCVIKKHHKPPKYEICVMGGGNSLFTVLFLDVVSIVFIIFSVLSIHIVGQIIFYVFGIVGIIGSILGFYNAFFNYVAFCNDKIILKSFFVTKDLPLTLIKRIDCSKGRINFYKKSDKDKYYRVLFEIDASASDAAELVHKVDSLVELDS